MLCLFNSPGDEEKECRKVTATRMQRESLCWIPAICVLAALCTWGCADQRTTCSRIGEAHVACSHKNIMKDYGAVAQWTAPQAVQLYVPEKDRGRLEPLDPNGKVLKGFQFKALQSRWVIYVVGPEEPLSSFQVVPPSGQPYTLQITTPQKR